MYLFLSIVNSDGRQVAMKISIDLGYVHRNGYCALPLEVTLKYLISIVHSSGTCKIRIKYPPFSGTYHEKKKRRIAHEIDNDIDMLHKVNL